MVIVASIQLNVLLTKLFEDDTLQESPAVVGILKSINVKCSNAYFSFNKNCYNFEREIKFCYPDSLLAKV